MSIDDNTNNTQTVTSLGIGPFEFPIAGTFEFERDGLSTVLTTPDGERRIYLILARKNSGVPYEFAQAEAMVRGSWERFVEQEHGAVTGAWTCEDLPGGLRLAGMASEFMVEVEGESEPARQYYVQFAVFDGLSMGVLFFEGFGAAMPVLEEMRPLIRQVKLARPS